MARRLPVYLVLDISGSMSGEPIAAVENGVQTMVSALRQDPYALETAHLSVITFGSDAKQIIPLTELTIFQAPSLQISGSTNLGDALKLLAQKMDSEVTKTTADQKGDWKPLVFLMTDGYPDSGWQSGLTEFKKRKTGMVVACAAGQGADINVLKQITENVVQLDVADRTTLSAFFKWISSSISTGSQKVDSGTELVGLGELPPPPEVNIVV